jgi:hypothetical protein
MTVAATHLRVPVIGLQVVFFDCTRATSGNRLSLGARSRWVDSKPRP